VRTLAWLAFVGGVAALAAYTWHKPTIARGRIVAADLLEQNRKHGWRELACDDEIPIGVDGARFHCNLVVTDGDRMRLAVWLQRDGSVLFDVISTDAPAHRHVPRSADPWD
jgi:hypothetical protein